MRAAGATIALTLLGLIVAPLATALPAKEYRKQETIRCSYGQGCARMRNNAISHARTFCSQEGGVLKGERRGDYTCEQRGIYCVVTGRIECVGRVAATDVPGPPEPPGLGSVRPVQQPPRERTCLDADCARFISHAPGRRERDHHACPEDFAMLGLGGRGHDIVCGRLPVASGATKVDRKTTRREMNACPAGMVMRGVSDDGASLLCTEVKAALGSETSQDESGNFGIQVCLEREERAQYLTGLARDRRGLLCAPFAP